MELKSWSLIRRSYETKLFKLTFSFKQAIYLYELDWQVIKGVILTVYRRMWIGWNGYCGVISTSDSCWSIAGITELSLPHAMLTRYLPWGKRALPGPTSGYSFLGLEWIPIISIDLRSVYAWIPFAQFTVQGLPIKEDTSVLYEWNAATVMQVITRRSNSYFTSSFFEPKIERLFFLVIISEIFDVVLSTVEVVFFHN